MRQSATNRLQRVCVVFIINTGKGLRVSWWRHNTLFSIISSLTSCASQPVLQTSSVTLDIQYSANSICGKRYKRRRRKKKLQLTSSNLGSWMQQIASGVSCWLLPAQPPLMLWAAALLSPLVAETRTEKRRALWHLRNPRPDQNLCGWINWILPPDISTPLNCS